jgi:ribose transport system substrate-binding protein
MDITVVRRASRRGSRLIQLLARRGRALIPLVLLAGALGVSACGESDSSDPGPQSGSSDSKVVAAAKAAVEDNYAGTDRPLPDSSPPVQRGKTVWVIACSLTTDGCRGPAEGAAAAGKAIGWNMKLVDGKLDPSNYNAQIRAAIAAKADAVVLEAIDCGVVRGAIGDAKAAGIKIYGIASLDCDDRYTGGEAMFDAEVQYGDFGTYGNFVEQGYARAVADYVIAKTDGKAKVIEVREEDILVVRHINDGFEAAMERCGGCEVIKLPIAIPDLLQGKLQGKVSAALAKHPDANVVMAPFDSGIALGIGAAVAQAKASGRELLLTGGEGQPANVRLLKEGTQDMIAGSPLHRSGWAAIDGLNRLFAGEEQVDSGIGWQTIDQSNPLPDGAEFYDANPQYLDYQDTYRGIWQAP